MMRGEKEQCEVRYLSGEPDYKSVNLTWEVESLRGGSERDDQQRRQHKAARGGRRQRAFNVYYCEMQNWGPHRCRSKTLTDDSEDSGSTKQYTMTVKNLRMATKYSFHVKPQTRPGDQKVSGRSEHDDDEFDGNSINLGQTIIIPTKGFSAHATQCLPHASEIEVETGPYFGGRISSENGHCNIQGDANSPQESYTMRIEHENCGSHVSPEDLTVETYITVQENLGILTHSTRRFVVVCTFQPDTLTVRARLALPGKGRGGAAPVPMSDYWPATGRNARVRQFNMVDKSSLVLKASDEEEVEDMQPAHVKEVEENDVIGEVGTESSPATEKPSMSSKENEIAERKGTSRQRADKSEPFRDAKYARLFETKATAGDNGVGISEIASDDDEEGFSSRASVGSEERSLDLPSLLISACLAVIMIGAFVYVLLKEYKKQRIIQQHHQIQTQQTQRPPNRMAAF
ncbi:AAEL000683-PA [Aedes aegypti]|uniref:AAEL000683-PA n=1 Tax=Aedes aegypti TaxID=7159 RepID=Q17NI3_AEDAE|nr:AAEL000683-PA [Aedes aegypti]